MTDKITNLPSGAAATEPGAYRTPIEHYHSQAVCIGPSVSSSGLRAIELQSPHRFWSFSELNPKRFERPTSDAFDFGKAAHALLLGDEDFDSGYVVSPFDSFRSKAAQEWRAEQTRIVVTEADIEHIRCMADALQAHGLPDVIFGGEPEVSLIWQDVTGVWIKARPDALPASGDLGDLKTTSDAGRRFCLRQIAEHGYDMQMALCVEGMEKVLGRSPQAVVLIFVEKKAPYTVTAIPISENALYWARCRNRRAIDTFARCLDEGVWPSDGDDMGEYDVPAWLETRLSEQQADGRLPNIGKGEEA